MRSTLKLDVDYTFSNGSVEGLSFGCFLPENRAPWQTEDSEVEGWNIGGSYGPFLLMECCFRTSAEDFLYDMYRGTLKRASCQESTILKDYSDDEWDIKGPMWPTPDNPLEQTLDGRDIRWAWSIDAHQPWVNGQLIPIASDSASEALQSIFNQFAEMDGLIKNVRVKDTAGVEVIATSNRGALSFVRLEGKGQVPLSFDRFRGLFLR